MLHGQHSPTEGTGLPNPHERFTTLYNTYQARVYGYAVARAGPFFVRLHRARRRLRSAIDTADTTPSPKPVIIPGGKLR
jgi:DNA-directed RNA polymerase specialized sigma24 family protein